MSAPQNSHPRRRPFKGTVAPFSTYGMLRKSGTYSSPKSLTNDICDLENQRFMPRRSPTSTESLEDLIEDPSVRRVTSILDDFDKAFAGHKAASESVSNILSDPEVLPVPTFLLDHTTLEDMCMDLDEKPSTITNRNPHDHASDSGLGSSIGESKSGVTPSTRSMATSAASTHSAVTRSFSALGVTGEEKHTLGEFACKQIHDTIVKPILAEDSLRDFHSLVRDVPRRIGDKNICNLRDLEKTLIFLAPEYSASPETYLQFCERSIQLLHTAVDCLPEPDLRLPTDRPYTNNYFLDLIEQIRRYAAIMAATQHKESHQEPLYCLRGEVPSLRGGGSPTDDKATHIDEEECRNPHKRSLSEDEMNYEEAMRSMARRRKSEKPGDVVHQCRDCKKEFKRPCDLTKHEKTHSRPWKCSEKSCKYFQLGWPTEKERDRHMNDKHSAAPAQYQCLFPPCTYASKRESNCKQHMEKAHGWVYVRSKNNGKKAQSSSTMPRASATPLTPYLATPPSETLVTPPLESLVTPPSAVLVTPNTSPFGFSPAEPMMDNFGQPTFTHPTFTNSPFTDPTFTGTAFTTSAFTTPAFTTPAFTDATFATPTFTTPTFADTTFTDAPFTNPTFTDSAFDVSSIGNSNTSVQSFPDEFRRGSTISNGSHLTYSTGPSPSVGMSQPDPTLLPEPHFFGGQDWPLFTDACLTTSNTDGFFPIWEEMQCNGEPSMTVDDMRDIQL